MNRGPRHRSRCRRSVFLTLAALAVVLRVLIPAGFMTEARAGELPFALVICTGDGPMSLADHAPVDAPDEDRGHAPCAFAGHGVGLGPTAIASIASAAGYAPAQVGAAPGAPAPGRGLAAPPPPATGPPIR